MPRAHFPHPGSFMERVVFVCLCFPLSRVFKHKGSLKAAALRKAASYPTSQKGNPGRLLVQVGSPALAATDARGISAKGSVETLVQPSLRERTAKAQVGS